MLCRGSVHMMKWRQLFWIAFCLVKLSGTAAGSPTDSLTAVSSAVATAQSSTGSVAPTGVMGSTAPTQDSNPAATTQPTSGSPSSPGLSSEHSPQSSTHPSAHPSTQSSTQTNQTPTPLLDNHPEDTSSGAPTTLSPTPHPRTTAAAHPSASTLLSSTATPRLTAVSEATTQLHTSGGVSKPITCHNIKEVRDGGALCLRLNESHTCKHFLDTKGSDLWSAICEEDAHRVPPPCQIKLATSEVDQECLLLVLDGNTDPAMDVLRESHWEKFGIKSLERGSVRSHQDFSRKTLTALVTSGLLLAALGMAGYFLMRRRSWSPAGQRLDEDHYDLETGSQGSPAPQEKPSANGAQENGASRNGRGTAQSLADTSM
ncbi:hematopoietic progenitor cell antigen CD34 isoform X1 [Tympanuchus pallidicinctus]|uniref:hematopoietic progenitor cell antigen CD34 isoform X1 n=1 Tax=Tympanuchus pallidicinctus TaxID=109042 RepID=UPI002286D731|nr:hematopoietic progenitor cell antigen CD34 isoform X1 [Tympanuchus pallidicinctus]